MEFAASITNIDVFPIYYESGLLGRPLRCVSRSWHSDTLHHLSRRELRSRGLVHAQFIGHVRSAPNKEGLIWFLLKMEFRT